MIGLRNLCLTLAILVACGGERDLSDVKQHRTRSADGIVKLYANERQGDWMLKGNVILVHSATVQEIRNVGGRIIVDLAGSDILSPLLLRCTFHKGQTRRARTLKKGDNISIKAQCDGLKNVVLFSSGVLIALDQPA